MHGNCSLNLVQHWGVGDFPPMNETSHGFSSEGWQLTDSEAGKLQISNTTMRPTTKKEVFILKFETTPIVEEMKTKRRWVRSLRHSFEFIDKGETLDAPG
ncbi:hypothetical protein MRB53_018502 [Persea americana]|uniref:Uncharacterized protein n=1 Tax=Persea americana TaxID=3435 RepID=A0ACC2M8S2_PERAE|nr:hypothetical protein MRB53_018502 [Persea americana]